MEEGREVASSQATGRGHGHPLAEGVLMRGAHEVPGIPEELGTLGKLHQAGGTGGWRSGTRKWVGA